MQLCDNPRMVTVSIDKCFFEKPAKEGQLFSFKHEGFWKCMDTLRDKNQLNDMWATGKAKWKVW